MCVRVCVCVYVCVSVPERGGEAEGGGEEREPAEEEEGDALSERVDCQLPGGQRCEGPIYMYIIATGPLLCVDSVPL